jgi:Uma2 family endonuclease
VLSSPADIQLGPRTLVQPDLFIVVSDPEHRFRDWADAPVPLLAVEILSPSTAARDRGKKRRLYLEAGVEEYWIVDLDARLVERWKRGDARPEIVEQQLDWSLAGAAGSVELRAVFPPPG